MIQGVGKTESRVLNGSIGIGYNEDGSGVLSSILCDENEDFNNHVQKFIPTGGLIIPSGTLRITNFFTIHVSADLLTEISNNNISGGWRIESEVCDGNSLQIEKALNKSIFLNKNSNHYFICKDGIWINNFGVGSTQIGQFFCESEVEKMSKSKYNVVNPDDVIAQYGADCFRMFEMFLGPIEQSKPWDDKGISGVSNFLKKFWRLFYDDKGWKVTDEAATDAEMKVLHKTIKKIADDIERLNLNTCVSAFMIATNELTSLKCSKRAVLQPLLITLAPFAPFVTEELWSKLGNTGSIHQAAYPAVEEKYLTESEFDYPVSINGKVRAQVKLGLDITAEEAQAQVMGLEAVAKWTNGAAPKKFVFVKGRIINVVV